MDIYLHNTLTGKKEKFESIKPKAVGMYNCGPTVYFFAHIGNMRAYVFADILKRTFEYSGLEVEQIVNITDVGHLTSDADEGEDKIEQTARKEDKTAEEITKFYEDAFHKDLADLNIETKNTKFPKATEHIKEQTEIIKILEEKGFAYKISDGIYFDTGKFENYGKLGNINIKEQKEGARVEANSEKRNPTDFALWKFSKSGEKRLQEWESPWGTGFPGWHIECSAMSRKYLGQPFDIHTGGIDHIPVHHNNEIAQSEAAFGVPPANFWLHNEFITAEGEKMSKSIGNVFTISDLKEKKIHPLAFRLWLLSGHYRSPMNFTWDSVSGAHNALQKLVLEFNDLPEEKEDKEIIKKFEKYMGDDLDTPKALALLHESFSLKKSKKTVEKMDEVLGLNIKKLAEQIKEIPEEILELKKERDVARAEKNFQRSDELRKEIEREGYILEDKENDSIIRKTLSSLI
ncbi:MAG: cysteine--tRNA ligase [Candidatus Zambryskibacteria bacterium]